MAVISSILAIFALNIWVGTVVQRSDKSKKQKQITLLSIWLIPFFGALIFLVRQSRQKRPKATSYLSHILDMAAPQEISVDDQVYRLPSTEDEPLFDWEKINAWLETSNNSPKACDAVRRVWALHLRDWLGDGFRVYEDSDVIVLSSQEGAELKATVDFIHRSRAKIVRVLKDISHFDEYDKSLLILLDDNDSYYSYVAQYETDQAPISGGVFIRLPTPHFVARKDDLSLLEATLVHELTHSALNHLALPVWVDEGLAVNTEYRIAGMGEPAYKPEVFLHKHKLYWDEDSIQGFWSGKSFQLTGDAMLLSYELARILIQHLSQDWESFKLFVQEATYQDAAEKSAAEHCGVDLGASVSAILEKEGEFGPVPSRW